MNDYREHTSRLERLEQVAGYDLDATRLAAELDALAARTARLTGHPVSMVNVLLPDAQRTVGSHGLAGSWMAEVGGVPAEWSFCLGMVISGEPLVLPDTGLDPRVRDNPFVQLGVVRSYAGVPLVAPSGAVLGGHCVLSGTAGACTDADLEALRAGAREAVEIMGRYRRPGVTAG